MSTHPNAMLIVKLTPDGLARKTYRDICEKEGIESDSDEIKVGEHKYSHMVMEGDYDENFQISAKEGDIVLFDFLTYGYGEQVAFDDLIKQKEGLEEWAKKTCEANHCNFEISIGANFW